MGYLCTCALRTCTPHFCISGTAWPIVFKFGVWVGAITYVLSTSNGWCTSARAHVHTPPPYLKNRLTDCAKIWWLARDPIVMRFADVGGWVTARTHVRLQFRCLGSPWTRLFPEAASKTGLFLSPSLVHRQTWRLTDKELGLIILDACQLWSRIFSQRGNWGCFD